MPIYVEDRVETNMGRQNFLIDEDADVDESEEPDEDDEISPSYRQVRTHPPSFVPFCLLIYFVLRS